MWSSLPPSFLLSSFLCVSMLMSYRHFMQYAWWTPWRDSSMNSKCVLYWLWNFTLSLLFDFEVVLLDEDIILLWPHRKWSLGLPSFCACANLLRVTAYRNPWQSKKWSFFLLFFSPKLQNPGFFLKIRDEFQNPGDSREIREGWQLCARFESSAFAMHPIMTFDTSPRHQR